MYVQRNKVMKMADISDKGVTNLVINMNSILSQGTIVRHNRKDKSEGSCFEAESLRRRIFLDCSLFSLSIIQKTISVY